MIPSRTLVANLLRVQVASTLPGGYWKYVVQSGDSLSSIVQNKVLPQGKLQQPQGTSQQVNYYLQHIVGDVRNHLSTVDQAIFPGQILYIPKRVA